MRLGSYVLFVIPEPILDDSNWDFQLFKFVSRNLRGLEAFLIGRGRLRLENGYVAPIIDLDAIRFRGLRDLVHYPLYNLIYLFYTLRLLIARGKPRLLVSLDSYRFFLPYLLLSTLRVRKLAWWGGNPFQFLRARSAILPLFSPLLKLMTITIAKAAEVLVSTDSESAELISRLSKRKVHKIISLVNVKPFINFERRGNKGALRIVYSGRISEEKNLQLLVSACRHIRGCELVLTGYLESKPYFEELLRLAREMGVRMEYLGFLPLEEMAEVYSTCDVAVLPSKSGEGSPGFLLVAFAAGLPFVGPSIGEIPELVGKYGEVFKHPIKPRELAAIIERTAREKSHLSREIRQHLLGIYERNARRWERIITFLLQN